ncbi:TLC domain-containing protein [Leptodontidium sp. 2 PMI_412]|nr:TLC domain-containing protein [Leptodontidium sp. 2 PMI_412]
MLDPFFAPIPILTEAVKPLCDYLSLKSLPLHIHEILFAFGFYHIIFEYLAPPLSSWFLPKQYKQLSYESKLRWNMHCASMVQCCNITMLALWTIYSDNERRNMNLEERMWGYTGAAALVQALATGYFLFDLVVMVRYLDVFGLGMLAHALSCLITYTLGFRPIFNYYGCVFMLYELSTPFLNIHWFFDKMGMTGTRAQLYNGIALLVVFFSCRLVWGAYSSFNIYRDVWNALHFDRSVKIGGTEEMMQFAGGRSLPMWLVVLYMSGHVTLQALNVFWFGKMIAAVKKRFVKAPQQNGVQQNGVKKKA